jgi:hypothetical protein
MAAIELGNIFVRFYHGNERDETIAQYLGQFDQSPKGVKQTRAKELLHLGLQALEQEDESSLDLDAIRQIVREEMAQATPSLDRNAVRDAVRKAMRDAASEGDGPDFTLSDIRQVVSVVLAQELDKLDSRERGSSDDGDETDDEIEDMLDQLGQSLMMDEDDLYEQQ